MCYDVGAEVFSDKVQHYVRRVQMLGKPNGEKYMRSDHHEHLNELPNLTHAAINRS